MSLFKKRVTKSAALRRASISPLTRRLRLETLEDRRLLATFAVDDSFSDPNEDTDGDRNFLTIQAAVAAAKSGDSGRYTSASSSVFTIMRAAYRA